MKEKVKLEAKRLRKQGCGLNHIARTLGVSKSTASLWCRDVRIPASAKALLDGRTKKNSLDGLARYAANQKKLRRQAITEAELAGVRNLGSLSKRDIYCIGLGLYWGEGYKRGSQEFGFTNSDPRMVEFYIKWLGVVFSVPKTDLIFRVSINMQHQSRVKKVEEYWQALLNVPVTQFTKTSLIKTVSKKKNSNKNNHMGTLRIKVRKGTRMRREILGAIKSI